MSQSNGTAIQIKPKLPNSFGEFWKVEISDAKNPPPIQGRVILNTAWKSASSSMQSGEAVKQLYGHMAKLWQRSREQPQRLPLQLRV